MSTALGLAQVGCYYLSPVTITSIQSVDGGTIIDNTTEVVDSLKSCGRYATMKNLAFFGLSGSQCYCSPNVTDFIQGGPLEACDRGCTDCVEVYQITERENFGLSVGAVESCGHGYCKGGEGGGVEDTIRLLCSRSTQTSSSLMITVQSTLLLLWVLYLLN